ncbi:Gfo/Idh/MocA family oxidoreductase [Rhizobium sp. BK251]|uniref:Gfo/Idh/MocA family protein n=1 Tax=Rhizobium sp. BK251 TaxID=2512125 RepID=UPI0010444FE6|nr:Gfo/Idh/MocA family oxidoreductase [Rhizobium sp. BK251]TCL70589.1 putative dehydrogenase [Rhizobium sp. BK251]
MNSSKIRVGIVGVHPEKGWATIAHIPALKLVPDFEITAVSHYDPAVARAAAAKFSVPNAYGTTQELVRDPQVDLVVISVKVMRHRELVEEALGAGKSVYCEWPLAINLDQAIAMARLAHAKGVHAAIGLQTRATPVINYIRDLIKDGYVGDVLSTTLVGSGISWGGEMPESFLYTLDPRNGAGMLQIPFAHSLDAVLHGLDTRLATVAANFASSRKTTRIVETGQDVLMGTPDQVAVSGTLQNGAFINAHFRGGLSRATNFHWEINGSSGDLLLTTPVGYTGAGGFRLQGARQGETLHDLEVPKTYENGFEPGLTQSMALSYQRLAADMRSGSHLGPTFDDAVELHRTISLIEDSRGPVRAL